MIFLLIIEMIIIFIFIDIIFELLVILNKSLKFKYLGHNMKFKIKKISLF